jgi:hypothetical protein
MVRQKMKETKKDRKTSSFLTELAARSKNKAGKDSKLEVKEVKVNKDKQSKQKSDEPQINSREKEEEDPPLPEAPQPIRIKGQVYQSYWDEDLYEWIWPDEVKELMSKKNSKKGDKVVKKDKKKNKLLDVDKKDTSKKDKKSKMPILGKNRASEEESPKRDKKDKDRPNKERQDPLVGVLNQMIDIIAERVAEKISSQE